MRFHEKAWLAWAVASGAVAFSTDNPFASLTMLVALALVAAAGAHSGPEGRSFVVLVKIGLLFIAIRVVLFGLTGHTGDTTLITLPQVGLPKALGGFALGGIVTAEVLAQSVAEGLKIAAFLATFGVLMSVVDPSRIIRLLPRRMRDAGLVLGIALTFVPTMLRTAADVRDAQRLRGVRSRGLRALRPVVVPVVAEALERSLALAASMESRGYGGERAPTRLRADGLAGSDVALIGSSAAIVVSAVVTRGLAAAQWYPYPSLVWPSADLRVIGLAASIAAPILIAAVRAARLSHRTREVTVGVSS